MRTQGRARAGLLGRAGAHLAEGRPVVLRGRGQAVGVLAVRLEEAGRAQLVERPQRHARRVPEPHRAVLVPAGGGRQAHPGPLAQRPLTEHLLHEPHADPRPAAHSRQDAATDRGKSTLSAYCTPGRASGAFEQGEVAETTSSVRSRKGKREHRAAVCPHGSSRESSQEAAGHRAEGPAGARGSGRKAGARGRQGEGGGAGGCGARPQVQRATKGTWMGLDGKPPAARAAVPSSKQERGGGTRIPSRGRAEVGLSHWARQHPPGRAGPRPPAPALSSSARPAQIYRSQGRLGGWRSGPGQKAGQGGA